VFAVATTVNPGAGFDILASLFDEVSFTFKDGLETHNLRRITQIDLIKQKDCTFLHCFDDWSMEELSLAIHQSEPTDQSHLHQSQS
jgi:hypothetical protein